MQAQQPVVGAAEEVGRGLQVAERAAEGVEVRGRREQGKQWRQAPELEPE